MRLRCFLGQQINSIVGCSVTAAGRGERVGKFDMRFDLDFVDGHLVTFAVQGSPGGSGVESFMCEVDVPRGSTHRYNIGTVTMQGSRTGQQHDRVCTGDMLGRL